MTGGTIDVETLLAAGEKIAGKLHLLREAAEEDGLGLAGEVVVFQPEAAIVMVVLFHVAAGDGPGDARPHGPMVGEDEIGLLLAELGLHPHVLQERNPRLAGLGAAAAGRQRQRDPCARHHDQADGDQPERRARQARGRHLRRRVRGEIVHHVS